MENVKDSVRLEYWRSKAKVMQNRIEELEKATKADRQDIVALLKDVLNMREWAKTVVSNMKELTIEIEKLKSKEGDGSGHSDTEALSS